MQKGSIRFSGEEIIDFQDKKQELFFELPDGIIPDNNLLGYVIATMVGKKYDKVTIDLELDEDTRRNIEKFTNAEVIVRGICNEKISIEKENNIILNFSGGFDSLAVLCLLPKEKVKLVFVDFGGWFEREKKFAEKFSIYCVKTNFRRTSMSEKSLNLAANDWRFMGCGAILLSNYLKASFNVFGTILEASVNHFMPVNTYNCNVDIEPFSNIGMKDIGVIRGITEIGTAMIVSKYVPELINESLNSLAAKNSEKRKRKEILVRIVDKKFHRNLPYIESQECNEKIKFGTNFALDFLVLYIIKNCGIEVANETIIEIPNEAIQLSKNLELNFYERLNTNYISTFPDKEMKAFYFEKLLQADIIPYTEEDWKEYRIVADFLNHYHKIYA